jgi:hypothetical protein
MTLKPTSTSEINATMTVFGRFKANPIGFMNISE